MRARILPFLVVVFAVVAAVTCYNLMLKHVTGTSGQSWFEAGCSDQPGATASCAAVLQSPYSYFPAKFPDAPPGREYVPVAYLGLLYYTVLALWFVGIGAPSRSRAWLHSIPTVLLVLGLAGSAYYLFIMFTKLDAWCPWCVVTHVCNGLIAICIFLLWPAILQRSGAREEPIGATGRDRVERGAPDSLTHRGLHPTGRVVLLTMIAIVAVLFSHGSVKSTLGIINEARANKRNAEGYAAMLKQIQGDPVLLATHWERTPEVGIARRPDDPVHHYKPSEADKPPLDVVIFSDFECSACDRFARFLEAEALPLFAGQVQVTYKHYPIDKSCNSKAKGTAHPHACKAAKMAEAARTLGGNDAFWRAHDFLFNNRKEIVDGKMTSDRLAAELSLDAQALATTMNSEDIANRITADCEQASKLGITSTPAVYVEGRSVSQLARAEPGFWNVLADMYWNGINVPRPETTKVKPKEPVRSAPPTP